MGEEIRPLQAVCHRAGIRLDRIITESITEDRNENEDAFHLESHPRVATGFQVDKVSK